MAGGAAQTSLARTQAVLAQNEKARAEQAFTDLASAKESHQWMSNKAEGAEADLWVARMRHTLPDEELQADPDDPRSEAVRAADHIMEGFDHLDDLEASELAKGLNRAVIATVKEEFAKEWAQEPETIVHAFDLFGQVVDDRREEIGPNHARTLGSDYILQLLAEKAKGVRVREAELEVMWSRLLDSIDLSDAEELDWAEGLLPLLKVLQRPEWVDLILACVHSRLTYHRELAEQTKSLLSSAISDGEFDAENGRRLIQTLGSFWTLQSERREVDPDSNDEASQFAQRSAALYRQAILRGIEAWSLDSAGVQDALVLAGNQHEHAKAELADFYLHVARGLASTSRSLEADAILAEGFAMWVDIFEGPELLGGTFQESRRNAEPSPLRDLFGGLFGGRNKFDPFQVFAHYVEIVQEREIGGDPLKPISDALHLSLSQNLLVKDRRRVRTLASMYAFCLESLLDHSGRTAESFEATGAVLAPLEVFLADEYRLMVTEPNEADAREVQYIIDEWIDFLQHANFASGEILVRLLAIQERALERVPSSIEPRDRLVFASLTAQDQAEIDRACDAFSLVAFEGVVASAGPTISGGSTKYIEFIEGQRSRVFCRVDDADWPEVERHLGGKMEDVLVGARVRIVGRITEHHGSGRNLVILGSDAIEVLEPRVRWIVSEQRYKVVQAADEEAVNSALNRQVVLEGAILTERYLGDINAWFVQVGSEQSSVRLLVPKKIHRAVLGTGSMDPASPRFLRVDGHLQLYGGFPAMAIQAADQIIEAR